MMDDIAILRTGEKVKLHLRPRNEVEYSVVGGINFNSDKLRFGYEGQFAGKVITIKYFNATGASESFPVILREGGRMVIENGKKLRNPIFSFLIFSSDQEVETSFSIE